MTAQVVYNVPILFNPALWHNPEVSVIFLQLQGMPRQLVPALAPFSPKSEPTPQVLPVSTREPFFVLGADLDSVLPQGPWPTDVARAGSVAFALTSLAGMVTVRYWKQGHAAYTVTVEFAPSGAPQALLRAHSKPIPGTASASVTYNGSANLSIWSTPNLGFVFYVKQPSGVETAVTSNMTFQTAQANTPKTLTATFPFDSGDIVGFMYMGQVPAGVLSTVFYPAWPMPNSTPGMTYVPCLMPQFVFQVEYYCSESGAGYSYDLVVSLVNAA
jgi:hypothetical protein